ncbi:MAG: DUF4249 domain-containing protein [Bacteroidetes bacterium]|nr:DUF4249 domain-containing protein [Bacteroidota bacterium]MBT3747716.1 DUF4249 domain-containing protein [Bacteroidota bacterium]MBT4399672.1 DUF4249 domain-containing protein [Bacteroidota bacterium]MBT4409559.1 DUF4249 domain-containing protein [Bacteroidota bacterium]MBT5425497.1 DUF4249 domain-containing protein [Bacteroidota bacterium]
MSSKIILVVLVFSHSCIDPFLPDTTGYDDMLFFECLFSDDTSQVTSLSISRSVPMLTMSGNNVSNIPAKIRGASARIDRNDGEQYIFTETEPGLYVLPNGIIAEIGKSYKLIVHVEQETFESQFQTLIESPPIDTLTYNATLQRLTEDGEAYQGYRFYISSNNNDPGPSYYRWDMNATFKYTVPFAATHTWDGREVHPASNRDLRTCWKSKNILGIFVGNSEGLAENKIQKAPLHFESQYGDALSIRYSLLVKQHAISESVWSFWNSLDKLVNQSGGLYETQPFRVEGNIHCTTNPELFVAGIFEVSGVTEKRIFLNQPTEFEIIPVNCTLDTIGTEDLPWYRVPVGDWITEDFSSGEFFTSNQKCYDCTQKGGTTVKPPFWIHD